IFNINLDLNINWTVEAGIKIHNAQGSEVEILKDVFSVKLTANNPILVHEFVLKADSSITGDGTVNLSISVPENVTQIKTECSNTSWPDSLKTISVTSGTASLSSSSVPAGNYELTIKFYSSNGTLVYSTIQNICVLANFETKNWIDNGSGLVSSNSLTLTSTHVNQFASTQIYVASTSASSITDPGNDNTGLGTKYFPYETLSAALKKIDSIGSSSTDYTIWVNGNVSGTTVIDSNLIASTKAHSITIEGCTGNSTDKLNGTGGSSSVIKVDSTIPFIIKNLTVTGGSASKGGGIYITKTGASVTLAAGAKVSGNTAIYGKGVYVEDGDFILTDTGDVDSGNDVYLKENKVIKIVDSVSETDTVKITPEKYKRGMHLVESATTTLTAAQQNRFKLSEYDEDWTKNLINSDKTLMITSPVYVAGTAESDSTRPSGFGKGLSSSDGAVGTKHKPFSTIADALTVFDDSSSPAEIEIVGTVTGAQIVGGSGVTINASALTIKGYIASGATTSDAVLNGGGTATSPKTTLTVNTSAASFPVTIQNIKITGGNNTNGGGINIASGATVMLGAGVKINKNTAKLGGGIYNAGTLFMYGNAIVGYNASSAPDDSSTASNNGGNTASGSGCRAGGIYNSSGTIYLGYMTTTNKDNTFSGGIIGNYSADQGGGVFMSGGSLYINRGSVSYNKTGTTGGGIRISDSASVQMLGGSVSGNVASSNAGGFYVGGSESLVVSGGSIEGNEAGVSGGAVYLNSGTLTMSGGTMGGSTSDYQNTAGTSGGAIYQNGTFKVSGSAYVYTGSEKTNDVYLASEKVVTINSNYNGSGNTASNKMALTPANWKRGSYVLGGVSCNITNAGYFKITDSEWSILTDSTHKGKIDAQIWVAGKGKNGNSVTLSSGVGDNYKVNGVVAGKAPNDSNRGTKTQPYATIKKAVEQCWSTGKTFTIKIDGTLYGEAQEIPAANSTAGTGLASEIILENNSSGATIDRGLTGGTASATGSALTINTTSLVTIKTISITGGNKTGNGGGLNIAVSGAKVNLNASNVKQNKAGNYGGGIYVATGATLCMYSSATVGRWSGSTLQSNINVEPTVSNYLNKAFQGGGIYCDGTLAIAKIIAANGTLSDAQSAAVAINGNIATNSGGGICFGTNATLNISQNVNHTLKVLNNLSGVSGGGIYNQTSLSIIKISICGNKAVTYGGGIYNSGTLLLGNNCDLGGSDNNTAGTAGGAVYHTGTTFTMSDSACIFSGSGTGVKTNDIFLSTGKTIVTDSISSTGSVGIITLNSNQYKEGDAGTTTVMTKGANCSDSQFKIDTGKFVITPDGFGNRWYIKDDGIITSGFGANASNIADVFAQILEDDPSGNYINEVHICGSVSQNDLAAIATAMKNTSLSEVYLDLSTATLTGTINTSTVFQNCTKLREITFDVNTFPLSGTMFNGCTNLDRLTIHGNVTSWPSGIFNNCGNLASIEFKDATSVMIPGTDYFSYDGTVIELSTSVRNVTLGPLDSSVFQYMCGIRYYGTRAQFKSNVTVTKSSANIETKAQFDCYGESGLTVYWKGYAAGTAGGRFVDGYDEWNAAY
ncbi:leucine-rich repeat protein, partial [Treponema sp.]|uniref:leucine-rich repeat protein n=1 Tax=Treponema sp. TaxID=166 RepID=UPI00298DFD5D